MPKTWMPRLLAALVWLLLAFGVVAWSLKLLPAPPAVLPPEAEPVAHAVNAQDIARALGPDPVAAAPAPAASAPAIPDLRIALTGVVADRARGGVALISVDGKPARPYRVGSRIEERYTLVSVQRGSAELAPVESGGRPMTLELPQPSSTSRSASTSTNTSTSASTGGPATPTPGTAATPSATAEAPAGSPDTTPRGGPPRARFLAPALRPASAPAATPAAPAG